MLLSRKAKGLWGKPAPLTYVIPTQIYILFFLKFSGETNTIKQKKVFAPGVHYLKTMAQLYLVAFKENNNGTEPEENYALRELLDEYCSA